MSKVYVDEIKNKTSGQDLLIKNGTDTAVTVSSTGGVSLHGESGTSALEVHSSGRVSMPKTPAFHAVKTGNSTSSGYLIFNSVSFNQGGHYDSSNGKFTAPEDGIYLITFSTLLYNMNSSSNVLLHKNGSNYPSASSSFGVYGTFTGTYAGQGASAVIDLSANDYVQMYFSRNSTNLHGGFTWWSGAKLA